MRDCKRKYFSKIIFYKQNHKEIYKEMIGAHFHELRKDNLSIRKKPIDCSRIIKMKSFKNLSTLLVLKRKKYHKFSRKKGSYLQGVKNTEFQVSSQLHMENSNTAQKLLRGKLPKPNFYTKKKKKKLPFKCKGKITF